MSQAAPARFPKHARLRKRSDFLRVQHNGRRHHTDHFVVLSVPNARPISRFGITVSTRVGNAVVRNRVKRVIREILRTSWRAIDPPGDVVSDSEIQRYAGNSCNGVNRAPPSARHRTGLTVRAWRPEAVRP